MYVCMCVRICMCVCVSEVREVDMQVRERYVLYMCMCDTECFIIKP